MGHKKSQTTTQKVESNSQSNPWAPAQDQLKSILNLAQQEFDKSGGLSGEWINRELPDLTPEMKSSLQAMAESGNLKNVTNQINQITAPAAEATQSGVGMLENQGKGGLNISGDQVTNLAQQLYDQNTVDNQEQELEKDLTGQYESGVQELNQQAGGTGNMGNSRAGVAQGVMMGKAQEAYAKGAASIENTARTTAQQQALSVLGQNQSTQAAAGGQLTSTGTALGGLQQGNANIYNSMLQNQYNAANVGQAQAQNVATNNWFNATGAQGAGQQNLANYLSEVGAIGGMGGQASGTNTTTNKTSGGGGGLGGILGGISTAAGIAGTVAQSGGSQGFGFWSDASMKKNVKKTGESADGVSEYSYEWNEKGKKKGMKGKAKGVLAQQAAKEKPSAVAPAADGALTVDYKQTGVKPKNSKRKS